MIQRTTLAFAHLAVMLIIISFFTTNSEPRILRKYTRLGTKAFVFCMSVGVCCLLAFISNYMNSHQQNEKELEITHSASEIFSITLDAVFCLALGRNDKKGNPPGTAASRSHLEYRSQTQISSITKRQFEFFIAIGDVFEEAFSFMVLITVRRGERNGKLLGCESFAIKSECFRSFFKQRTANKGYITRNSV